jgi:glycosyltransferase involved in cell wall biosynthesis
MLSVIIPSRQPEFLQKTIDDLLAKAEGEVEIIVILDGYWPVPMITGDNRVKVIHQGTVHNNLGMRAGINAGISIAQGEYIMKIDEHCLVSQGYDLRLARTCQPDYLVVPRRYRLDAENWQIIKDGRPHRLYVRLLPLQKTAGFHLRAVRGRRPPKISRTQEHRSRRFNDHAGFLLVLAPKDYFDKLFPNGMDDANYGPFNHEAQELSNTVWLSGGRVVVDKAAHYAHYHKGKNGKGYGFSREQYRRFMADKERARLYAIGYWLTTKDFEHDWEWLMEKFSPVPTWPDNWQQQIKEDQLKDWSTLGRKTWQG